MTMGMITLVWCAGTAAGAAALFEPFSIDVPKPFTRVFLAECDADNTADIVVLAGQELKAYSAATGGTVCCSVRFEAGTSAFDIADLDADGRNEVVAVWGERLVRYELGPEPKAPTVLFEQPTLLSDTTALPYPHVIVVQREGGSFLALPLEDSLEFRAPDGALKERHAFNVSDEDFHFSTWTPYPARLGPPEALEFRISRSSHLTESLPEEFGSAKWVAFRNVKLFGRASWAADKEYAGWPWFPLKTDQGAGLRVLYVTPKPDRTLIRVYQGPADSDIVEGEGAKTGPAKLYTGEIVVTEDAPDFNGDGFVDLVLHTVPVPGISLGAITRTITGTDWPVRVMFHLFSPELNRYEAKPFAKVACNLPPLWLALEEDEAPMRDPVFRDFDGDGLSDCGWHISENEFAVWLCRGADGFAVEPDWRYTFPEEGARRLFACELVDGSGANGKNVGTSLVFRGEKTLYVFVAGS